MAILLSLYPQEHLGRSIVSLELSAHYLSGAPLTYCDSPSPSPFSYSRLKPTGAGPLQAQLEGAWQPAGQLWQARLPAQQCWASALQPTALETLGCCAEQSWAIAGQRAQHCCPLRGWALLWLPPAPGLCASAPSLPSFSLPCLLQRLPSQVPELAVLPLLHPRRDKLSNCAGRAAIWQIELPWAGIYSCAAHMYAGGFAHRKVEDLNDFSNCCYGEIQSMMGCYHQARLACFGLRLSESELQPAQDERALCSTFVCYCSYSRLITSKPTLKLLSLALY